MKDLKCGLKICTHNKGYCCCAKNIKVGQNTECLSFSPDRHKNASLFEAGSDFVSANYSVDTKVGCDAPCLFQKNEKCVANGITVMNDTENNATCLTFVRA